MSKRKSNTGKKKTSARADKPDDAEAIKIGDAYKTLVELKKIEAKATGDVELREAEIGGMLIDVRLVHKRKFGKWLDDNAELLGFKRAHAYNLINCAMDGDPWHRHPYGGVTVDDFRSKAADRAQKWRDKNKEKLARLQAFENAEKKAREAKRRDKAKRKEAERKALGPSRFEKETILGDGTVVPTAEPTETATWIPKTKPNWQAKGEHFVRWLNSCPRTIRANEFAPKYVEALFSVSETIRTTVAHLTRLAEAIEAAKANAVGNTEIDPVGDDTIVEQIAEACGGEMCEA